MGKNGKRLITFDQRNAVGFSIQIPCGQCIGCRLDRSQQWAARCMHEAQFHERKCFVTLTYSDENLPPGNSLRVRDFQLFMKRLRKAHGGGIRFFHCGEYGETTKRPHYHALLYGVDFADQVKHSTNAQGHTLYVSETLNKLWGLGHCLIGELTFETAAYTARYIMKKVTGDAAQEHYKSVDIKTGEIFDRQPEYITMSRRPGIGREFYDRFTTDIYPEDFIVTRGQVQKVPKYYDRLLEKEDPELLEKLKNQRQKSAKKRKADNTPERLKVREEVKKAQISKLSRSI